MKLILAGILFSANAYSGSLDIESLIIREAVRYGVNPNLAVAIAKTESGLNPKAVGSKGEIGLFQLRPEYHKGNLWNPVQNTRIAMRYLKHLESMSAERFGRAWFISFNLGPYYNRPIRYPQLFPYYKKVMSNWPNNVAMN